MDFETKKSILIKICQKILSLKYTLKVIIILFAKLRIENDQLA